MDCKGFTDNAPLSENASAALKDFKLSLKCIGKDALDEEGFNKLLDDVEYKRSRDGLFESLIDDIAQVTGNNGKKAEVTANDLAELYASESYHLLDCGRDSGDTLMTYADRMVTAADTNNNGKIDIEKCRAFINKLVDKEQDEEEFKEVFKAMDADGSGEISCAAFKQAILKVNKNVNTGLPNTFNYNLLLPTQTPTELFVSELENFAKNHRGANHHILENLTSGSFGSKNGTELILILLSAYAKYNKNFTATVEKLIEALDSPADKEILQENLNEEMGNYDEETLQKAEDLGIPRESIDKIPHKDLYIDLVKTVEKKLKKSVIDFLPDSISDPMLEAQVHLESQGVIGLLTSLYYGSELIVPMIYSALYVALRNCGFSNKELRFLLLHISMDCDHSEKLREIIMSHSQFHDDRLKFAACTERFLRGRIDFFDAVLAFSTAEDNVQTSVLYDRQATKWSRSKPRCLSDFTGRPVVYDMMADHIKGNSILDVGCGEGFVARKLIQLGAAKVVGLDVSPGMIEAANSNIDKSPNEHYLVGDSAHLKQSIINNASNVNVMLGAQLDVGTFDCSVAVFLFNYMTISKMVKTFTDVYSLLKPGGHFVFSVPHPFMASISTDTFGFGGKDNESAGFYFGLRDKILNGHISTIDGHKLNVRMQFKTIEDYFASAKETGFEVVDFREARVEAEHLMGENKEFFEPVSGHPLHLVIKLRKPENNSNAFSDMSNVNSIDLLPKKINWSNTISKNVANSLVMHLPDAANKELVAASLKCFKSGVSVDDLVITRDIGTENFTALKPFAVSVRKRLLHETGCVFIKGLDMSSLGGAEKLDQMTECSKLAYFIICEHIGTVDATARGKLFDVKSANLDATSKKADNVLFSVSDSEAGWHTDGASKDRVYDVVALLCISPCISPAGTGSVSEGKFRISNACDVYDDLNKTLPKFMMYELTRAVPRDILENGKGKGTIGAFGKISRTGALLAMRIRYNSYPIYVVNGDRMRFRYMRHWIETGHEKTMWKVPTLLKIAMDLLDDHLDKACCFHDTLERGDMVFANNSMIAHARDQFKDKPGAPPRHKVRAWLQVQKTDINSTYLEKAEAEAECNTNTSLRRLNSMTSLKRVGSVASLVMQEMDRSSHSIYEVMQEMDRSSHSIYEVL